MPYCAVLQDACTRGILVFKMSEVNSLTCTTCFYDVHRDGSEITIDSHENPSLSGKGMVSPLLPAFMLGVAAAQKHDKRESEIDPKNGAGRAILLRPKEEIGRASYLATSIFKNWRTIVIPIA